MKAQWLAPPGIRVTIALSLILFLINGVAIWGIIAARQGAQALAQEELRLRALAHARSLEAALASRRSSLLFLAQSSPVASAPETLKRRDPMHRRWGRLDIDGALILFMAAHPEVERLIVRSPSGDALAVAGRRDGAPVLLPPGGFGRPEPRVPGLLIGAWPLGGPGGRAGARLEAVLDTERLLRAAVPDAGPGLALELRERKGDRDAVAIPPSRGLAKHPVGESAAGSSGESEVDLARESGLDPAWQSAAPPAGAVGGRAGEALVAAIAVSDDGWSPPSRWLLVCREIRGGLSTSLAALAGRYRLTVILNLVVVSAALLLGAIAFQQLRRGAALEAENRQRERIRELERLVAHSERLAGIGRLAAGLAHEINNPLEGMANYLSLLEDDVRAGRLREVPEVLAQIRVGLERAAGITRQVLLYATPGTAPHGPVDIAALLEETARFVRSQPAHRGAQVEVRAGERGASPPASGTAGPGDPAGGPPGPEARDLVISGNRVALSQLILNLALNACQWQPEGGEVELSARRRGDLVEVTVADRGPGIPGDALPRIFEPFYSRRGSTGLGLAVCQTIAAQHGGTVAAENRPGGGACFRVVLPVRPGAVAEAAAPAAGTAGAAA